MPESTTDREQLLLSVDRANLSELIDDTLSHLRRDGLDTDTEQLLTRWLSLQQAGRFVHVPLPQVVADLVEFYRMCLTSAAVVAASLQGADEVANCRVQLDLLHEVLMPALKRDDDAGRQAWHTLRALARAYRDHPDYHWD